MIIIENTEVYGWEAAIRGMRNPMNSREKSDTIHKCFTTMNTWTNQYILGENDFELMKKLVSAGTDHSKFMRMINVTCDITAPLYWWKEFDTYKVGTVRNSCSTMHKIHEKEFTLDDFSHENLITIGNHDPMDALFLNNLRWDCFDILEITIEVLNYYRNRFLTTKDKIYWWQIIRLLPSSYNQRATVQMNYQVLRNMYCARKNHKLDEWREFCHWIEELPYSELITGSTKNDD